MNIKQIMIVVVVSLLVLCVIYSVRNMYETAKMTIQKIDNRYAKAIFEIEDTSISKMMMFKIYDKENYVKIKFTCQQWLLLSSDTRRCIIQLLNTSIT